MAGGSGIIRYEKYPFSDKEMYNYANQLYSTLIICDFKRSLCVPLTVTLCLKDI